VRREAKLKIRNHNLRSKLKIGNRQSRFETWNLELKIDTKKKQAYKPDPVAS